MTRSLSLDELTLRSLLGNSRFKRAVNYLASGQAAERKVYRNGVLAGRWGQRDLEMIVFEEDEGLAFDCLCNDYTTICDHAATLALAWVRQPETFTPVAQDYDIDAFGEETDDAEFFDGEEFADDFDAEFDAPGLLQQLLAPRGLSRPLGPLSAGPRPRELPAPASPALESLTWTLSTELPDMSEDYLGLLGRLTVSQMRALAARRGVTLSGNKREPIVETLAAALGRPQSIAEVWPTLSPAARLALSVLPFITTAQGVLPQHLRQTLKAIHSKAAQNLEAALEELKSLGLVFDDISRLLNYPNDLFSLLPPDAEFLPALADSRNLRVRPAPGPLDFARFVTRLLLALKSEASRLRTLTPPDPHPVARQMPEIGTWPLSPAELDSLAGERNPYATLHTRKFTILPAPSLLADDSVTALTRALEAQPEPLDFALHLLAKSGVVTFIPGRPPVVLEEGFAQFVSLSPVQQIGPLFSAWISLRDWAEFDLTRQHHPKLRLKRPGYLPYGATYPQFLSSLAGVRAFFQRLIRRAPAGQWIDLEAFIARAHSLNLLQAMWFVPPGISLELDGRVLNPANADDWRAFYGPFVETLLTGPFHWQGLVDLGYRKDQLVAFRLTELGAFATFQTETFTPPPITLTGRALKYGADGALTLQPVAADPQLLGLLSVLGEVRGGSSGELVYRPTPGGATRAFQAGWDADHILSALEKAAGARPPASLTKSLRQWWAHFGDVHLYTDLALIELADDYALNELLAGTSLSQYLLYRFTPRLIAIRPEGVEALQEELVNKGYTPKLET